MIKGFQPKRDKKFEDKTSQPPRGHSAVCRKDTSQTFIPQNTNRVKPLEWSKLNESSTTTWYVNSAKADHIVKARTPISIYHVFKLPDETYAYTTSLSYDPRKGFETLEEAQATAQAEHRSIVSSMLEDND